MKVNKIYLGIFACAAAFSVCAQEVKIFGNIDAAVGSFEKSHATGVTNLPARTTAFQSGVMSPSVFGVNASEDLGGGLKAAIHLEGYLSVDSGSQGVSAYNSSGSFWARDSSISITRVDDGGVLALQAGQSLSLIYLGVKSASAFGESIVSPAINALYLGASGTNGILAQQSSAPNAVTAMAAGKGWSVAAQASLGEHSGKDTYSAQGFANVGIADFVATYSTTKDSKRQLNFGAHTNIANVDLYGQYTEVNYSYRDTYAKAYEVSAGYQVTQNGKALVAYGKSWSRLSVGSWANKTEMLSAGWTQTLSKRTQVYAVISRDCKFGEEVGDTYAVGIKHSF